MTGTNPKKKNGKSIYRVATVYYLKCILSNKILSKMSKTQTNTYRNMKPIEKCRKENLNVRRFTCQEQQKKTAK
jgi:hypothetical protein